MRSQVWNLGCNQTLLLTVPLCTHMTSAACAGLLAFELPLVYVKDDSFNQPIFGCKNLSGAQPTLPAWCHRMQDVSGDEVVNGEALIIC